jgi:hypothetical protein
MDILTLTEMTRLDRVFHNVVNAIHRATLPNLMIRETKKFSITGGVIKSLVDDSETHTVSIVDEMEFDREHEKFVPVDTITVYASKHGHSESGATRVTPVRKWILDPEATNEIAFVIAHFFLGHNHLLNRHFTSDQVRKQLGVSLERYATLVKIAND